MMILTGRQLVSNRSGLSHAPVIVFLQLILICLYNSSHYYGLTLSSCRYRHIERVLIYYYHLLRRGQIEIYKNNFGSLSGLIYNKRNIHGDIYAMQ